jgi:hypothetical protein
LSDEFELPLKKSHYTPVDRSRLTSKRTNVKRQDQGR